VAPKETGETVEGNAPRMVKKTATQQTFDEQSRYLDSISRATCQSQKPIAAAM
jgi:hypothetical protein